LVELIWILTLRGEARMAKAKKEASSKSVNKLQPLRDSTRRLMDLYTSTYRHALERGKKLRKVETKKYGGTPLPSEPGGEKYFEKV
jgi:hypothetical protein